MVLNLDVNEAEFLSWSHILLLEAPLRCPVDAQGAQGLHKSIA